MIRNAIIGIDPGLNGAMAVVRADGSAEVFSAPTIRGGKSRRLFDEPAMVELIATVSPPPALVVIEDVAARPGQGVTSMFRFGVGFGLWLGIIAAFYLPHERVPPQVWKREMIRGVTGDKAAALVVANRLFPGVITSGNADQKIGKADALLIAEWGRRRLTAAA